MTDEVAAKGIGPDPVVGSWELRSVATMLKSIHGDEARSVAAAQLANAEARNDEGDAILWRGIPSRLREAG